MRRSALLLTLALLTACEQQSTTPTADDSAFDLPSDIIMHFAEMELAQKGIRRAQMTADTLFAMEQSRQYDLRKVNLIFFDDAGRQAGTLTSTSADYDTGSGL